MESEGNRTFNFRKRLCNVFIVLVFVKVFFVNFIPKGLFDDCIPVIFELEGNAIFPFDSLLKESQRQMNLPFFTT